MAILKEPEGIAFFSVKTGETFHCKLEPTIQAMINSSDMGINASRGQDFGWRLAPEWVKKVRDFRNDETKVDSLAARLRLDDGVSPSTTQILYYIYGREVRAYLQRLQEEDAPFEEQYQSEISSGKKQSRVEEPPTDTITEDVSDDDLLPPDEDEEPTKPASKPKANQAK